MDSGGPVDGRAARWAGQRAKRRAEIVTAALAAIGEHGPEVSTEQIARRAGIARPLLYRHFTDAEDLYDAIAHRAADLLVAQMSPVLRRPSGTAHSVIARIVGTFVLWMTDNVSLYDYVMSRPTHVLPGRTELIADVRDGISAMLRDLLAGYLVALSLDTAIADPLAHGLVGMVESTTRRWLTESGTLGRDELVAQLSAWVWGLLVSMLRAVGVILDPDEPLPELPA